ncbi:DDE_3 domain-containing protein [Trichonephila clavipes]|nr:DDE_3 domain-containing protein [Trichonephila clavipes]
MRGRPQRSRLVEQVPQSERYDSCSVLASMDHRRDSLPSPRAVPIGKLECDDSRRVILSNESLFSLNADDQRIRVWKRPGPAFFVERQRRLQKEKDEIFTPVVLPMLSSRPGALYQQDNARTQTTRLSQQYILGSDVFPWPTRSSDFSPTEQNWDELGRQLQPSNNPGELTALLQRLWPDLSRDVKGWMSRMETGSPISINEYTERLRICAEIDGHDIVASNYQGVYKLPDTAENQEMKEIFRASLEETLRKKAYLERRFRGRIHLAISLIGRKSPLSLENKVILYKQILRPVITYTSPVWGAGAATLMKEIQAIQNKILRLMTNAPCSLPTANQKPYSVSKDPATPLVPEAETTPTNFNHARNTKPTQSPLKLKLRKLEFSGANAEGVYTQCEEKRKTIKNQHPPKEGGMNEMPANEPSLQIKDGRICVIPVPFIHSCQAVAHEFLGVILFNR